MHCFTRDLHADHEIALEQYNADALTNGSKKSNKMILTPENIKLKNITL